MFYGFWMKLVSAPNQAPFFPQALRILSQRSATAPGKEEIDDFFVSPTFDSRGACVLVWVP